MILGDPGSHQGAIALIDAGLLGGLFMTFGANAFSVHIRRERHVARPEIGDEALEERENGRD